MNLKLAQRRYDEAVDELRAETDPRKRRKLEGYVDKCERQLRKAERDEGYTTGRRR